MNKIKAFWSGLINRYGRRTIIIILSAIAAVVILFTVLIVRTLTQSEEIRYSSAGQSGNSACNLYNRGLFCEKNGRIYFSNHRDDGLFYCMNLALTNFQKLYADKVRYINADENYVYYSRTNNLKSTAANSVFSLYTNGIFRYDPADGVPELVNSKPLGAMMLYNNRLYFQHYNTSQDPLRVISVDISGQDEQVIFTDDAEAVCAYNGRIFYGDILHDHYLHSVGADGSEPFIELQESVFMPYVNETGVYYIATDDKYRLWHMGFDGTKECLISDRCSTYNFSKDGRYIYYQRDGGSKNGFYVYDTQTGEKERILPGDFKWFNVVAGYCFFYDFTEEHVYVYSYDGSLSEFFPPVITD